MYWFTADEHYNHANILQYCNRPFANVEEMNETLIANHNAVVTKQDITVHVGDFAFGNKEKVAEIIKRLNGSHIFIKGSHDAWLPNSAKYMWRGHVNDQFIVACHYAMRTWERARIGSWHVYGHSHGRLPSYGKSYDVGVDKNLFMPVSFDDLSKIMSILPEIGD